jgi:threonine/homoserine/homoserine lactone efflux protein
VSFLKGLVVGFSIAAPVGPIGVLCIRRALAGGARAGFVSGLGAATADAAYACVAAFGLTAVSGFLVRWQSWLGLGGGAFLLWLGAQAFRSRPGEGPSPAGAARLLPAYGSTLLLTLSNPATLLSFVAVFVGTGLGPSAGGAAAGTLVLGVFSGSAAWWLLLSVVTGHVRERVAPAQMRAVNIASGVVLAAFGAYALVRSLR